MRRAVAIAVARPAPAGSTAVVARASPVGLSSARPPPLAVATVAGTPREGGYGVGNASAPEGWLSGPEYAQLAAEELLIVSLVHARVASLVGAFVDWPDAVRAATASPRAEPLLVAAAERSSTDAAAPGGAASERAALCNALRWLVSCPLFQSAGARARLANAAPSVSLLLRIRIEHGLLLRSELSNAPLAGMLQVRAARLVAMPRRVTPPAARPSLRRGGRSQLSPRRAAPSARLGSLLTEHDLTPSFPSAAPRRRRSSACRRRCSARTAWPSQSCARRTS